MINLLNNLLKFIKSSKGKSSEGKNQVKVNLYS